MVLGTGIVMLAKSTRVVVAPALADEVFDGVDVDGNGFLDRDEIKLLLVTMGDPIAEKRIEHTFKQMAGPRQVEIGKSKFKLWCIARQSSASMSLAILFFQTAGLIAAHSGLDSVQIFNIFNLDCGVSLRGFHLGLLPGNLGLGVGEKSLSGDLGR